MNELINHLAMGGYGAYVWTAYGVSLVLLGMPWWFAWQQWRRVKNAKQS